MIYQLKITINAFASVNKGGKYSEIIICILKNIYSNIISILI